MLAKPDGPPKPVALTVKYFAEAGGDDLGGKAQTAVQEAFFLQNPDIRLKRWSGLTLPGNMWMQADLLAFAGGVAADVQTLFFHQVQFYASQRLLAPLDDLVAPAGSSPWPYWQSLPDSFKRASTLDGKIYAIPTGCFVQTLLFRREIWEAAGLDSSNPPATLEEFWRVCQKLTDPNATSAGGQALGRYAFTSDELKEMLMPLFFACGATFVETEWLNPQGEVVLRTRLEDAPPASSPAGLSPRYIASFDSAEAREALEWLHKFRWAPWVRDPQSGVIRDLTEEEAAVTANVIRGVVRPVQTQDDKDRMTLLRRGRTGMAYVFLSSRTAALEQTNLGICPIPPLKSGSPSPSPLLPLMMALNRSLSPDPVRLDAAWRWVKFRTGAEASAIENTIYSENGLARSISVWEIRRSGMLNLLSALPPQWLTAQDFLFSGPNVVPFINGWTGIEQEIENGVISPLLADPNFDSVPALGRAARMANEKVLGHVTPETHRKRSTGAMIAFGVTVLTLVLGLSAVISSQRKQARTAAVSGGDIPANKRTRILFYSCLLLGPALILLAVFGYYPVFRGLVMAFQDYRLVGASPFVGLENFAEGLFASRFWLSVVNTLVFVAINLSLGFLAPFLLAVLVSELPIGTAWFRTIYYLPAVTAGLVVTLLWMRLYEPTEWGLLNQVLEPVFRAWNAIAPDAWQAEWPVQWLKNSNWAMLAVIVPSIWASAGPGSLIYLAALKSIPDDIYEAGDLDGCGPWSKFRNITFPAIFPLLLINFIGAFIGAFQGMGNIFVMTGGGPNFATHVLALEIWQNAFLYLRFGVATAQAWMLAATLIGFVVIQLRVLEKMDWRKAGS